MDLQGYEIKNRTTCECGYQFNIHNMTKLQRIADGFYGGVIKHVSETQCPQCARKTLLLIKQQGQTYIVKDIAQKEEKNTIREADSISNSSENAIEQDEGNKEEFICPTCNRAFKSKSGLAVHMKTH